jgi:lipopolysaccharide/colanic/teichoic acid biosynthesis glycosyltransferase
MCREERGAQLNPLQKTGAEEKQRAGAETGRCTKRCVYWVESFVWLVMFLVVLLVFCLLILLVVPLCFVCGIYIAGL